MEVQEDDMEVQESSSQISVSVLIEGIIKPINFYTLFVSLFFPKST